MEPSETTKELLTERFKTFKQSVEFGLISYEDWKTNIAELLSEDGKDPRDMRYMSLNFKNEQSIEFIETSIKLPDWENSYYFNETRSLIPADLFMGVVSSRKLNLASVDDNELYWIMVELSFGVGYLEEILVGKIK